MLLDGLDQRGNEARGGGDSDPTAAVTAKIRQMEDEKRQIESG
jgi:hypothetical protein